MYNSFRYENHLFVKSNTCVMRPNQKTTQKNKTGNDIDMTPANPHECVKVNEQSLKC